MRLFKYLMTLAAAAMLTTAMTGCNTVEGAAQGGQEDIDSIQRELD